MKKCVKFKKTGNGRRCARFSGNVETDHSMVELSLKGYGLMNKSVNSTDVIMGAGIGVAGGGLIKAGIRAAGLQDKLPVLVQNWMPLLGAAAAGSAAYMLERKNSAQTAAGHLVGAVLAGAAAQAWGMMKSGMPEYFADVVALKFAGHPGGYGVLVNSPTPAIGPGAFAGYNGMIFNNPGRPLAGYNTNSLAGLGAIAMSSDRDGLEELMD